MKKLAFLFVVLAVIFSASFAFAGSADARTANYGQGISGVQGLGDLSSGNTAEVDSNGNLYTRSGTATVVSSTGATLNTGTALITGAANIQTITIGGQTAAGDYVNLYDALTATGTPKWEISSGTAKNCVSIPAAGAAITTGLFADSNDNAVIVSVVYN
jgi:hypothetical protein